MRRVVDVVVAALALVITAPLLLAAACAIRLTMGAPVLFRQRRSGKDGVEFGIVKFRSMRPERFIGEPDPDRLTRLGRIMRTTSIDELPQLWNVLRGEMSLIGPRPTLPEQVAHYSERQRGRLAVAPGLTGWAQVSGRNSLSWPQRIELDLWYIANRSVLLDFKIVVRTVRGLLRPSGVTAEGGVNPGFPMPDDPAAPTTPKV